MAQELYRGIQLQFKTTGFTAVTGTGYFCNTTGGPFTVTLPLSPSAGDVVGVSDYAQTFDTDTLTLGRNSSNIAGVASDSFISTAGIAVTLVYVDVTKGWIVTDSGLQSDAPGPLYIAATGGDAIVTCGNFKTHIFTNPGSFCVSILANPAGGPNNVDYLVVAGGGSGGSSLPAGSGMGVGGGGAGGFRLSNSVGCLPAPSMSPLATPAGVPVSIQPYSIVIGGGATAAPASNSNGNDGTDTTALGTLHLLQVVEVEVTRQQDLETLVVLVVEVFIILLVELEILHPVSPPQGNPGGALTSTGPQYSATGGGGAGATGQTNPAGNIGGAGGIGSYIADGFVGPTPAPTYGSPGPVSNSRYFAGGGGGGGGIDCGPPGTGGAGGSGGGGSRW